MIEEEEGNIALEGEISDSKHRPLTPQSQGYQGASASLLTDAQYISFNPINTVVSDLNQAPQTSLHDLSMSLANLGAGVLVHTPFSLADQHFPPLPNRRRPPYHSNSHQSLPLYMSSGFPPSSVHQEGGGIRWV